MNKIAVVSNRLVIAPISQEREKGGIILPESVHMDEANGIVHAVGPDADSRIKPGTPVVFDPKAGTKVKLEKIEYYVMRDVDLLYFYEKSEQIHKEQHN